MKTKYNMKNSDFSPAEEVVLVVGVKIINALFWVVGKIFWRQR